jgi:hypothetical protein
MTATQISAREFFQAAYDNRYTWEPGFPGYTADVTYKLGDTVVTGKVKVGPDMKAEVTEVADEAAQKAISYQLWETAIHRVRRSFEDSHGTNTFTYGETDAEGHVELIMGGKAEGDRYKVRGDVVTYVHRHIHGTVVSINTFTVHDTGEGYLAHTYDSVYHDPKTGEQTKPKEVFEDHYTKVGNYQILSRRVIQAEGKPEIAEFIFENIQLLG